LRTNLDFTEHEAPILVAGYHREWSPGIHTLALGAWLNSDQQFSDKALPQYFLFPTNAFATNNILSPFEFDIKYRNEFEIYSGELCQIFQSRRQTLILGGRLQAGNFSARDTLTTTDPGQQTFFESNTNHSVSEDFLRAAGYAYYTLEFPDNLYW